MPKIKQMSMKNHTWLFSIFFLFLCIGTLNAEDLVHILQKGETLFGISKKYHVPASAIMNANNILDPDKLKIGQKIVIPNVYTVQKGDTLYGIARKFEVEIDLLLGLNNLTKNSGIRAGDTLFLPGQKDSLVASKSSENSSPIIINNPVIIPPKPLVDPRLYESKQVDTKIIWPVSVTDISYLSGKLYGVSITSGKGEVVKAISSGSVLSTGPYRGFGQVVFLQGKTGFIYVYGGLDQISVSSGDTLNFGDKLGTLGFDSISGKPQLYFMVYNKETPVDPAKAPRGY